MDKTFRRLGAILAIALLLQPANATIIHKGFDAILETGPYAGTAFDGTFSYDNAGVTGVGTEYFGLASFNFTLLGTAFSKADIDQGGQAILQNGVLADFTAAIFPPTPWPAPVSDIAFGFGGPGVIGYIGPAGNFGFGSYTIGAVPIPEPATLTLFAMGLLGFCFAVRGAIAAGPGSPPSRRRRALAAASGNPGTPWRAAWLPL